MNKDKHQICTRCILDTSDEPSINFDEHGVCNYCINYDKSAAEFIFRDEGREEKLHQVISKIKSCGKGKKYDCVLGVSGGVDSTFLAYKVKQFGLRPLVVHLDNGWNSELAVKNIEGILEKLGFDLYTYVIDWEEFKDLQLSFLKASVIDLEVTSDHAIFSCLHRIAKENKIKYIISGFNIVTEGVLPVSWRWHKLDWLNIKSIHKRFGTKKLKTFPRLSFFQLNYFMLALKIETVHLLNFIPYEKTKAKELITNKLGWRDYGGKHYESIITRFYQGYILPTKFNVDKRKAHLSTLICSGQITRNEALQELEKPIYDSKQLKSDKEFVLKKFGLSEKEFNSLMALPIKRHDEYPSYLTKHYIYHEKFFKAIRPFTKATKSVYNIFRQGK
ncbi:MAG: ExsB family protein [Flavobacteriales bacterium]|nr:N-acetyl sugar amidotransferase [Bacteroidales bacterium AH-315-I05]PCJ89565.1 MAG: ExsB family protein [Flavobacteriales bacterium]